VISLHFSQKLVDCCQQSGPSEPVVSSHHRFGRQLTPVVRRQSRKRGGLASYCSGDIIFPSY